MRILVTNDDGIEASGIRELVMIAKQFGEVFVVAPDSQCSAMSQRIILGRGFDVTKVDFSIPDVEAYSVNGTPADCVRIGLMYLDINPDYVFSGINCGYNSGYDIAYSGTVGAAVEAVMNKVPAIAFSTDFSQKYEGAHKYLPDIIKEIFAHEPLKTRVWNVNVQGERADEIKGVLWNRKIASDWFIGDTFEKRSEVGNTVNIIERPVYAVSAEEGTDIDAIKKDYVSVGTILGCAIEEVQNEKER